MKNTDPSVIRYACASGHQVYSVVPMNEPERHRGRALADLAAALPEIDAFQTKECHIAAIATTPDFHAGKPVPVGVVIDAVGAVMPHIIGNDIGCGMRMIVLDGITEDDLSTELEKQLRHVHFQGGRNIALTGRNRHAILREGIPGLLESLNGERRGVLAALDPDAAWDDVTRTCDDGSFQTTAIDAAFMDYARFDDGFRYDAIAGTIGGGNHFVELGKVERIVDGAFARAAGLRSDSIVLIVHSGSLDFGQRAGAFARDLQKLSHGGADARILAATQQPQAMDRFLDAHANATNFAFVNRFLIGLASLDALRRTTGKDFAHRLVYDAPHNAIWREQGNVFRHRKGACPARGAGFHAGSPYDWLGEPVILPGSMGDGAWLLRGLGAAEALSSAAHGAGRRLSRQQARKIAAIPSRLRVVSPIAADAAEVRGRPDILREIFGRLKEEAPDAYRPIDDVVDPMEQAGLVRRVAKIRPVITVKG